MKQWLIGIEVVTKRLSKTMISFLGLNLWLKPLSVTQQFNILHYIKNRQFTYFYVLQRSTYLWIKTKAFLQSIAKQIQLDFFAAQVALSSNSLIYFSSRFQTKIRTRVITISCFSSKLNQLHQCWSNCAYNDWAHFPSRVVTFSRTFRSVSWPIAQRTPKSERDNACCLLSQPERTAYGAKNRFSSRNFAVDTSDNTRNRGEQEEPPNG